MTAGQRSGAVSATPRGWVMRAAAGQLSLRIDRRAATLGGILVVLVIAVGTLAISTGDYPIAPLEVARTLLGGGDQATEFIVMTLRLPRILTAVFVGAALGISGGVFQSIARNPLGSPDVIGFTQGAAAGAVLQVLYFGGGMLAASLSAIAGGMLTAVLVYALAYRGGVQGFRLVLVGIGIGAVLRAAIHFLLTRARVEEAQAAAVWLVGSLNNRSWEHAIPVGVALLVLLPVTVALGRQLSLLEMGDDAAKALGLRVEQSRRTLMVAAVALSGVAAAAAGPIAFVALAAPQIARRLSRTTGAGLVTAGLMGSLILLASDLAAQRVVAPTQLPVGVATGAIGGVYLAWLLTREWGRSRG